MASLRYVCCSVVECVAVCVAVCCCVGLLRCVGVFEDYVEGVRTSHDAWRNRGTCVAACCSVLQCVALCCSVLKCVVVCCGVLQCVAVCCSVLQCSKIIWRAFERVMMHGRYRGTCVAVWCNVLQCVAVTYCTRVNPMCDMTHSYAFLCMTRILI